MRRTIPSLRTCIAALSVAATCRVSSAAGTVDLSGQCEARIPEEQPSSARHATNPYPSPPPGYGAVIGWVNATVGTGCTSGSVRLKSLRLRESLDGCASVIADRIVCDSCDQPDDRVFGFSLPKLLWADPLAWVRPNEGRKFEACGEEVVIPVSDHPDEVYHLWHALWPRPQASPDAIYSIAADVVIEGDALVQIGIDYWPDVEGGASIQAAVSDWRCAATGMQTITAGNILSGRFAAGLAATDWEAGFALWDLSGTYRAVTTAGHTLVLNLLHDSCGRLRGSATYTLAKDTVVTMPIRGSVKSTRGSIAMRGVLRGAEQGRAVSVSLATNLTLDTANRQLTGPLTGSVKANGTTTRVSENLALDIPGGMDGTWSLAFDLDQAGRTVTGSATLTLSNEVGYDFTVKGKTGPNDTAVLTLTGERENPAAKAIRIKTTITPLEGGWARIEAFSGKAYGQSVGW